MIRYLKGLWITICIVSKSFWRTMVEYNMTDFEKACKTRDGEMRMKARMIMYFSRGLAISLLAAVLAVPLLMIGMTLYCIVGFLAKFLK